MRFDCGPTPDQRYEAKYQRLINWHIHFALWPTRIGANDCRWMEWIERKGVYYSSYDGDGCWKWTYRPLPKSHRGVTEPTARNADEIAEEFECSEWPGCGCGWPLSTCEQNRNVRPTATTEQSVEKE
jgi:hypothetical protein